MIIDSSGNVGIGISSPSQKLHLKDTAPMAQIESSSYSSFVGTAEANDNIGNGTKAGNLVLRGQTGIAISGNNGTAVQVKIDSDGLKFGTDTAAANALDDYEEGTWTPTIGYQNTSGITVTTNSASGKYTKIGRFVMVIGAIDFTTSGSPVNDNIVVGGLPFDSDAAKVSTGNTRFAGCNIRIDNTSDDSSIYMAGNYGVDSINLGVQQDMGNRGNEIGANSGMVIRVQIFYHTA